MEVDQAAAPDVRPIAPQASEPRDDGAGPVAGRLACLRENLAAVMLGKPEVIRLAVVALLAEGHVLIEDVPGTGKTLLAKAMARSLDCAFHRIQFTPDLLPSDLIGTTVFHQPTGEFVFKPGPLFANVVLADEINRATPRTQSALLEAMSDRQVSVDGRTLPLGPPFLVLATQNPYEFEGTYPLPESQLDRFTLRLSIGYPARPAEKEVLARHRLGEPVDQLGPVMAVEDILALQRMVREVRVDESLYDYILDLVDATRNHPDLSLGASTRAAIALYHTAQALALVEGRTYVVPDDVKTLAGPVLVHRLVSRGGGREARASADELFAEEILAQTPVPA